MGDRRLTRDGLTVDITQPEWAEVLLYLSKHGWQPPVPAHSLLAIGYEVSDSCAESLRAAGQAVLDAALQDPLSVYPVPFDMGKFAEIVFFCEGGGFSVQDAAGGTG